MDNFSKKIFGRKKFSDILSEIYTNQQKKSEQITSLINELKPLIEDIGDATLIVPLIKEYMDLGIKNDEQLIKMATIVQRALNVKTGELDSNLLTEEERSQLLDAVKEYKNPKGDDS